MASKKLDRTEAVIQTSTESTTTDDVVIGTRRDDTMVYDFSEQGGGADLYDGHRGNDTLELHLSVDEFNSLRTELISLHDWMAENADVKSAPQNSNAATFFTSFGLEIRNIENLKVVVDGYGEVGLGTPIYEAGEPTVSAEDIVVQEDGTVALNITVATTDPGDQISEVVITGVPAGSVLSAGTDNGDGSWILSEADLSGLTLSPPADYSGTFNLGVTATAVDGTASKTSAQAVPLSVNVTPVADAPSLNTVAASGDEDTAIALNISTAETDTDGSETLALTIAGVPAGATLSAGTDNGDGSWSLSESELVGLTITPPANYYGSFDLAVTSTSTDSVGAVSDSASTVSVLSVNVAGTPDAPVVSTTQANGTEDNAVALSISATGVNGVAVSSVTISGVPSGATLSAGTDNGDGTYTLLPSELAGLTFTPVSDYSGAFSLSVSATAEDGSTTVANMGVNVTPIADAPSLNTVAASGDEDTAIVLNISTAETDTDGSETLALTIAGVPAGATLSAGTDNGDGSWSLSESELVGLTITPPANYYGSFDLAVTSTSTDSVGAVSDSASTVSVLSVNVAGTPDAPVVSTTQANGTEDNAVALSISATGVNGVAVSSVTISGVPSGATLSAGTYSASSNDWTMTTSDLVGLQLTPPADYAGAFDLSVVAKSEDQSQTQATLNVNVAAVADGAVVTGSANDGFYSPGPFWDPDSLGSTTYLLNLDASLLDADGSEGLSVTIGNVPFDATLNAGTDNGDGTWTLSADDLPFVTVTFNGYASGADHLMINTQTVEQTNGDTWSDSIVLPLAPMPPVMPGATVEVVGAEPAPIPSMMGTGTMVKINEDLSGTQSMSNVAKLADGSTVFVWVDNQGSNDKVIEMRIFDAEGNPKTSELAIDAATADNDQWPDVTALSGGGYVVSWKESTPGTWTHMAKAQVFTAEGVAVGAEFALSPSYTGPEGQPSIEGTADGGFVAVWLGSNSEVNIRHFAADGTPVETTPTSVDSVGFIENVDIAVLSDGSEMVSWVDDNTVYTKTYDPSGVPMGASVPVASAFSIQDATVTTNVNGGYVLAWHESVLDSSSPSGMSETFKIVSYDSAGNVLASIDKPVYAPAPWHDQDVVSTYGDGSFVVTWTEYDTTTNSTLILAEKFDAAGTSTTGTVQVDMFTSNMSDYMPSVVAMDDGGFVVDWGRREDSGHTDIYAARYDGDGALFLTDTQQVFSFNLDGQVAGTDGTEVLTMTLIGLPSDASVSAGTDNGDSTWTLTEEEFGAVDIVLGEASSFISFDVELSSFDAKSGLTTMTTNYLTVYDDGSSRIESGAGDDVLTGGLGSDTFVFHTHSGHDVVTDFDDDDPFEILDLTGVATVSTPLDVLQAASQVGADTVLDFGGDDTVTLQNFNVANLDENDFIV